ncbi:MAG: beta-hydroxyacyl-ACP dehydratase [Rickettsiales bacterium]|jgi:acyl-coenzyme A synthetase/AMP-(fatty) acid ligase|nr:beta-hydroxyacyl-ACP dehydratase [Rickettsiales bacterium]
MITASSDTLCITKEGIRTRDDYLEDMEFQAAHLPNARFVINLCTHRYNFMLALEAAWQKGQTHLLPPNSSPKTLEQIYKNYPDSYILTDNEDSHYNSIYCHCLLPYNFKHNLSHTIAPIDDAHPAVIAFTSGSTGNPTPHTKTYGMLRIGAELAAKRFGFTSHNDVIVATVPHQHMYGLETTIMLPMMGFASCYNTMPFYPADLEEAFRKALESNPESRLTLVTTPLHLENFLKSNIALPPLKQVISATAPLSPETALAFEMKYNTQVFEIYGCTEAGSMASRRTTGEGGRDRWRPYESFSFSQTNEESYISAPHLPEAITLGDVLNLASDGTFTLEGRQSDMLNVAGKRASLQGLQTILRKMPGIEDGALFIPESSAHVERLTAIVVPRDKNIEAFDKEEFLKNLAQYIDPVFLPRKILAVTELPRLPTGKISKDALNELLVSDKSEYAFPKDHPAFSGHFPGNPIVPGVLLLAKLEDSLAQHGHTLTRIISAKFLSVLKPEQPFQITFSDLNTHTISAEILVNGEICAKMVCEVRKSRETS